MTGAKGSCQFALDGELEDGFTELFHIGHLIHGVVEMGFEQFPVAVHFLRAGGADVVQRRGDKFILPLDALFAQLLQGIDLLHQHIHFGDNGFLLGEGEEEFL
ncbi:MAG: hypothetical protein U5K79_07345 [Cyclobacteriaceae bacterium]|nr:hypothetical protein [Cyclobacteriaceae bacterium]